MAPVAAPAPAQGRYNTTAAGSRDDCTPPCTDQCWIEVFHATNSIEERLPKNRH